MDFIFFPFLWLYFQGQRPQKKKKKMKKMKDKTNYDA